MLSKSEESVPGRKASFTELFQTANSRRAQALDALIDELTNFNADSPRDAFTELFYQAVLTLEIADVELARLLKVSRPMIGRWKRGENVPSRSLREPVCHALAKSARKKLRHYKSQGNPLSSAA